MDRPSRYLCLTRVFGLFAWLVLSVSSLDISSHYLHLAFLLGFVTWIVFSLYVFAMSSRYPWLTRLLIRYRQLICLFGIFAWLIFSVSLFDLSYQYLRSTFLLSIIAWNDFSLSSLEFFSWFCGLTWVSDSPTYFPYLFYLCIPSHHFLDYRWIRCVYSVLLSCCETPRLACIRPPTAN